MAEPLTPEFIFRSQHRVEWQNFLLTPLGRAFLGALSSRMPWATSHHTEHMNHHKQGQIYEWQNCLKFIQIDLCNAPAEAQEPVAQNYPPGDEPYPPGDEPQPST